MKPSKIYKTAQKSNLSSDKKISLLNAIIDTDDAEFIYCFARDVEWIDEIEGSKEKLFNAIINTKDGYYIGIFADEIEWIDEVKGSKTKLLNAILKTEDSDSIYYFAKNVSWIDEIKNAKEKLLDAIISLGNPVYITDFSTDIDWIDEIENAKEKLLNAIVETNDGYIYEFMQSVDWIDEIENANEKLLDAIIKTNDGYTIFKTASNISWLNRNSKKRLLSSIIATNNSEYIYKFAYISWLNNKDKERLVNAIVKLKDVYYIYHFLTDVNWLRNVKKSEKKLITAIINTSNIEFINKITKDRNYIDNVLDIIINTNNPELIWKFILTNEDINNEIERLVNAIIKITSINYLQLLCQSSVNADNIMQCYRIYMILYNKKMDTSCVESIVGTLYRLEDVIKIIITNCKSDCSLSIVSIIGNQSKHEARIIYTDVVLYREKIVFKYYSLKKYTDIVLYIDNIKYVFVMQLRKIKIRIFTKDNLLYTIDNKPVLVSWVQTSAGLINLNYHTKTMNKEILILQKLELITNLYKSLEKYDYEISQTIISKINNIITSIIKSANEDEYKKHNTKITDILLELLTELNIILETRTNTEIKQITEYELLSETIINLLKDNY